MEQGRFEFGNHRFQAFDRIGPRGSRNGLQPRFVPDRLERGERRVRAPGFALRIHSRTGRRKGRRRLTLTGYRTKRDPRIPVQRHRHRVSGRTMGSRPVHFGRLRRNVGIGERRRVFRGHVRRRHQQLGGIRRKGPPPQRRASLLRKRLNYALQVIPSPLRRFRKKAQEPFRFHPRRTHRGHHGPRRSRHRRILDAFRLLAGREERFVENERKIGVFRHRLGIGDYEQFSPVLRRPRFLSGALGCRRFRRRLPFDAHRRGLEPTEYQLFRRKSRLAETQNQSRKIQTLVGSIGTRFRFRKGGSGIRPEIGFRRRGGRRPLGHSVRQEADLVVLSGDGHGSRNGARFRFWELPHPYRRASFLLSRSRPREESLVRFPYRCHRRREFSHRSVGSAKPLSGIGGKRQREQHALLPLEFEHDMGVRRDFDAFRIPHLQSIGILREIRGLPRPYRQRVPLGERARRLLGRIRGRRRNLRLYRTERNVPLVRIRKAVRHSYRTRVRRFRLRVQCVDILFLL